jgi:hypothetical protein
VRAEIASKWANRVQGKVREEWLVCNQTTYPA